MSAPVEPRWPLFITGHLRSDLDLILREFKQRYGVAEVDAELARLVEKSPGTPGPEKGEYDNFSLLITYLQVAACRRLNPMKPKASVREICSFLLKEGYLNSGPKTGKPIKLITHVRHYGRGLSLVKAMSKVEQGRRDREVTAFANANRGAFEKAREYIGQLRTI